MNNSFETSFISETVEKTPFANTPAQNFFGEWCRINDSIIPIFISREDWEKRGNQVKLEKNDQGKQTLFLPEDLHLWEMMDVIKTIDADTLSRKPEKIEERAKKIQELGVVFEKAGIYLYEYLSTLQDNQGETIAENIAREFYKYGLSLQHKERREDQIPNAAKLTQEDKAQLDEWFLGRDVYQKRISRLGEDLTEEKMEETRKKLFSVYFTALGKEVRKAGGEKPWENKVGPMQHLQNRTRRQITKAVETPEREMKTAIFRRGVENLVTEMKEVGWRKAINDLLKKVGFDPVLEQRRLYDTLGIERLKQELEEVRKSRDIPQISAKELQIAKKIQQAVSSFPYKHDDKETKERVGNNPSKMVETQFINCVGSAILGGGLLEEVGIRYLHADLPKHSITVLITSDGKVYWQAINSTLFGILGAPFNKLGGPILNYKEIQDKDITGKNKNGQPLTVADIVAFANNPSDEGIRFEINRWWYNLNMEKIKIPNRYIGLFKPEIGLQCHILNNTGNALTDLGRNEEAIEAYRQAISVDPKYAYPYQGLGNALISLGRREEAIEAYRQAISVDPKYADAYFGLGNALISLGRREDAIIAYQQFIRLWKGDTYWTIRVKKIIKHLQKVE
jgi:tetratricopeptide (TPR) repeat protein